MYTDTINGSFGEISRDSTFRNAIELMNFITLLYVLHNQYTNGAYNNWLRPMKCKNWGTGRTLSTSLQFHNKVVDTASKNCSTISNTLPFQILGQYRCFQRYDGFFFLVSFQRFPHVYSEKRWSGMVSISQYEDAVCRCVY